ncbi:MAG TPA: bifunctional UDP-N-acetylglucosamine diphosphorylase/glucosamine-1-phosphate N-acetyltransferase GlmU [Candidatus Limnocylindria bacterium]|jgi:bifunctional UDP-N-acetylglucosamine pyrophosphorylase/glucosamine-1-phosphate N-acetyltransferase|nr:bifunctional UDP-N-acetylglucosamine diphosphorylase/glucosamine-1-phosphate N-acetyltransferase GlmU [Candidatus Limnocylindria bacterium]
MTDAPLAIVLAAGLSTRMKSKTTKVLHPIAGRPLLTHVLETVRALGARPLVVLSKESEPARALLGDGARVALQDPPRGTGDAVRVALASANGDRGVAYIVYGDTPLLRAETLARMRALLAERQAALAILSGEVGTDNAYGRVVRDGAGDVARIVEARLASDEEKALTESNLGAYAADLAWLRSAVARLRANETGEVFLTDLVALATAEGKRVAVHRTDDAEEGIGVNTRLELAAAEAAMRRRIREAHMLAGVTFPDPESCQVDADVRIAADVVIERGTILEGKTAIGSGSRVGPYAVLRDTVVGERCRVENSTLEGATLEDDVRVGPYSHLRPGAYLERGVELGNFGEVKNARLKSGTKMHHFSYVGDAEIGARVNIGAGAITLNYDGVRKNRTVVGDDAFIGSDTLLRAPVTVGAGATTGAGAVVTKDVPEGMVAVGMPARAIKKADRRHRKGA